LASSSTTSSFIRLGLPENWPLMITRRACPGDDFQRPFRKFGNHRRHEHSPDPEETVMNRRLKIVIGAAAATVIAGVAAAGVAGAADVSGDDSSDVAITGTDLEQASEAALAETGGGEVVDSEVEDEENGYEVEVNLDDGRQVEVQLDANFAVVSSDENEEGDDGDAD
jgi:uncharacterized membrane protein YkoI